MPSQEGISRERLVKMMRAQTIVMNQLREENATLHAEVEILKKDRNSAISLMSKSWQHNACDFPMLLTGFVEMANRQFKLLREINSDRAHKDQQTG